ncbi:MAG: homocysteine biosynthesis protein [Candidatus Altiarchaeota archaeon]|nr:homocysteine biosynthesis protein [Candidatus Altiarchaeota archaeon]
MKTIEDINKKIKRGEAVVVRADEMPGIFEDNPKKAAEEVDIVTTGTFGMMCSSGVFLNFGHADPPIKMTKVWLNNVEAYAGIAAVDAYLGAAQTSEEKGLEYGGGHVIEDLLAGREVELRAEAYGTDCYPRKKAETVLTLDDLNQAILFNPRNSYQRYNAATNSSENILNTYMGTLLSNRKNINFSGTGEINPLINDPRYRTIGFGTRIFLGGAKGYVTGEGTQHNPKEGFGNISVKGNLKEMSDEFLKGATIPGYGTSLYVGIGIPIPILDEDMARRTAVRNRDIKVNILDYGVQRRDKPKVMEVTYEELFKGRVGIDGKKAKTSPLSSMEVSIRIMERLAELIENKEFFLTKPLETLPKEGEVKNMKPGGGVPFVEDVMTKKVLTALPTDSLNKVSEILITNNIDQVPIVDRENKLVGIVTAWDMTKAIAMQKKKLENIMTKKVITSRKGEYIDVVARKLGKNQVNSTPVVDDVNRVIGIITSSDINKMLRR